MSAVGRSAVVLAAVAVLGTACTANGHDGMRVQLRVGDAVLTDQPRPGALVLT